MTDIKVCTPENSGEPRDIVICDEDQTFDPNDIKVCGDDGRFNESVCPGAILSLSGSTDPIVGDVYTASGGAEPFFFSASSGMTINSSSGVVESMTYCQAYTITVTDGCGSSAKITTSPSYGAPSTIFNGDHRTDLPCTGEFATYEPYDYTTLKSTSTQVKHKVFAIQISNDSEQDWIETGFHSLTNESCIFWSELDPSYVQSNRTYTPNGYHCGGTDWWVAFDLYERCPCP